MGRTTWSTFSRHKGVSLHFVTHQRPQFDVYFPDKGVAMRAIALPRWRQSFRDWVVEPWEPQAATVQGGVHGPRAVLLRLQLQHMRRGWRVRTVAWSPYLPYFVPLLILLTGMIINPVGCVALHHLVWYLLLYVSIYIPCIVVSSGGSRGRRRCTPPDGSDYCCLQGQLCGLCLWFWLKRKMRMILRIKMMLQRWRCKNDVAKMT